MRKHRLESRLEKGGGGVIWWGLALVLVGLGGYWLYHDAGVAGPGLIEAEGGAFGIEDVDTKQTVVGAWDASGEGALAVAADGLRTRIRTGDAGVGSGTVLEIPVFLGPGRPLTKGSVMLWAKTGWVRDEVTFTRNIWLDGTNLLRVRLPALPDPCPKIEISASYATKVPGSTAESWRGKLTFPVPKEGKPWVVPDLVLKKMPQVLLCKGVVVDGGGRPVAGAKLRVNLRSGQRELADLLRWMTLDVGEKGAFIFRYPRNPGLAALAMATVELKASAPGYFAGVSVPFRVGTSGLRIALKKSASIRGSVILPPGVDASWLMIGLRREVRRGKASNENRVSRLQTRLRKNAQPIPFRFDMLRAGSYVLSLSYLTSAYPLIRIGGIEIRSGQDCRDVRVQKLDLRGLLKTILVRLRTDQGRAPSRAKVQIHVSKIRSHGALRSERVGQSGEVTLTIPRSGVDLVVALPDYTEVRFNNVRADKTIVLRAAEQLSRAVVQVKGGMPKNGLGRFWLELEPTSWRPDALSGIGRAQDQRIPAKEFSLSGQYYFIRLNPGSYRVRVLLKSRGRVLQRLPVVNDPIFMIQRTNKRRVLTVDIDRRRISQLLKEIKQREPTSRGNR